MLLQPGPPLSADQSQQPPPPSPQPQLAGLPGQQAGPGSGLTQYLPVLAAATAGPSSLTSSSSASSTPPIHHQQQDVSRYLETLQDMLKEGWTAHTAKDGRLYYCKFLTDPSSTLLRAFLPLLIADDFLATLWNVLYTFIGFTFLGFFTLFFTPTQVLITSLLSSLAAGASYLYLEEEIPARLGLPATAFTFAVALYLALELCPERRLLVPLLGTVFTVANAATYGYFGLLTLLWDSPDVVIIVLWAVLGFFALAMLVLCRELEQRKDSDGDGEPQRDVSSDSFRTVITTIA